MDGQVALLRSIHLLNHQTPTINVRRSEALRHHHRQHYLLDSQAPDRNSRCVRTKTQVAILQPAALHPHHVITMALLLILVRVYHNNHHNRRHPCLNV